MRTFIINYKAYEEAFTEGIEIAKYSKQIENKLGVNIIVAPPFTMLKDVKGLADTIAQGVDEVDPGAFTAHVTWFELKNAGIKGTLLNHSEKRYAASKNGEIDYGRLKKAVEKCKSAGLKTYVCVQNPEEARHVLEMQPTAIAYEPPELIGGDVSVSSSKPEIVKEFCDIVKSGSASLPLIGAGIKTPEDVKKSVELGAEGILVASGVMKSKDFESEIEGLAAPLAEKKR